MLYNKNNKGFTLLEVMIVILIMGVIVTIVANMNISGFRVWNFNQEKIAIQQSNRVILDRISPYIRSATEIISTGNILEIRIPVISDGSKDLHGMEFGLNNNDQFYYRKVFTDDSLGIVLYDKGLGLVAGENTAVIFSN